MDDPDDACWSWPHWKFGLKRDDLFTKLNHQYNTVPLAILDPEAFHHDVCEIAHEATSADEFHRRLHNRKEQRMRELNVSLESAAFEIIANPDLIGTEQWQHAVQLFRTRSFDSLVRYFASYLPHHSPADDHVDPPKTSRSIKPCTGSPSSIQDDGPIITEEPAELPMSFDKQLLPLTPRSMTMCSDSSAPSPVDMTHHGYDLDTMTPPRTLSYSESEPDFHDEDVSQPCAADSPATSVSDLDDPDIIDTVVTATASAGARPTDATSLFPTAADITDTETPTPKPERQSTSFFEPKPSLPHRRHRSLSPSRPQPLSLRETKVGDCCRDPRNAAPSIYRSPRHKRLECMAARRGRRFHGELATYLRKISPGSIQSRPRGRRQVES